MDMVITSIVIVITISSSRLNTVGSQRERLAVGSQDMGVWRSG